MWLLENLGELFGGRKLWLRPGKRYLFGRTVSEPGQLAISDKTISRKHLTIQVDNVKPGEGHNRHSRTSVTLEDLNTKIGTLVNGTQIRGKSFVLTEAANEIKMGHCSKLFRLTWHPVVLSFSFTPKELRADPWTSTRNDLDQLDIKYIAEYDLNLTSHVVAKKRNTSKGLQALVNGKYIVTDSFVKALTEAAKATDDSGNAGQSPLERDFFGSWPNALEHLPPRGEEPSDRPVESYAPAAERQEIFDGYTFVFYEKKQYDNLFPPITNGKGKALFREAVPHETEIDDFIRYVKEVAGEKGLGEFEDGSEGKGVVVVRYLPNKGDTYDWYANFLTSVSLRLDHRLVDQREFLDAILANNPAMLRRPLEVETRTQPESSQAQPPSTEPAEAMDVDAPQQTPEQQSAPQASREEEEASRPRRARGRRPVVSRFKGFDVELEADDEPPSLPAPPRAIHGNDMFMSQDGTSQEPSQALAAGARQSQRKRPASPIPEVDVFEELAPTAAAAKRRRIALGEDPIPRREPTPVEDEEAVQESPQQTQKGKKKAVKESEILERARKHREEAEKRAAEERQQLEQLPDEGIDFEEIRRLTIVEPMEVRQPGAGTRTREQDIADGRWDAAWNGRRNFKKFRKQGQPAGRPQQRVIVPLEEVRTKEYGIGDDYWLEDDSHARKKAAASSKPSQAVTSQSQAKTQETRGRASRSAAPVVAVEDSDSDLPAVDEVSLPEPVPELEPEPEPELPRTRAAKSATKASTRRAATQAQTQSSQRSSKRVAHTPPASEKAAKKPRKAVEVGDSDDDSDDGLKFRFGRRK